MGTRHVFSTKEEEFSKSSQSNTGFRTGRTCARVFQSWLGEALSAFNLPYYTDDATRAFH